MAIHPSLTPPNLRHCRVYNIMLPFFRKRTDPRAYNIIRYKYSRPSFRSGHVGIAYFRPTGSAIILYYIMYVVSARSNVVKNSRTGLPPLVIMFAQDYFINFVRSVQNNNANNNNNNNNGGENIKTLSK